jgi:C1A family cysteine protease
MMMKKLFLVVLSVSTPSFAGQALWTFTPTTATTVEFPSNLTSSIVYTISNQSSRSHRLVIKPIQGVTQVAPCVLEPKGQAGDTCTLNLSVTGSDLSTSGISGGPIVCQSNSDDTPNPNQCYQPSSADRLNISLAAPISDSIDWRARGKVTPVKNQGSCLSSYAFSTTGAVEGFYAINTGTLRNFSEQQIIDCSANAGCVDGTVPLSLQYIINHDGIATEATYPYTAVQGSCKSVLEVIVDVNNYIQVPAKNEIALAEQVMQQPVSAQISIGPWFQSYSGGEISPDCSHDTDYQNVLIVGYTSTYWIIKNSYGTSWGSQGYLYLTRGTNACGIANAAYAPS